MAGFDATAEVGEFKEAVAFFKNRLSITDSEIDDLTATEKQRAFFITGVTQLDVVAAVHESIAQAIKDGTPLEEWRETVADRLTEAWGKENSPRIECLPGDAVVTGAVVRAIHRRWHEGPLVEVITASGRKFSATPNHPMLTRRGWVATGELQEGDDLVCHRGPQDERPLRNHDVADPPPSIAELFRSCSRVGPVERVEGAPNDFHGDGGNSDVDVALPARELSVGLFATLLKPLEEHIFSESALASPRFCLACGHLLVITQRCGFCDVPAMDASLTQQTNNNVVGDIEFTRKGVGAFAGQISANNLLHGQTGSRLASPPPPGVEETSGLTVGPGYSGASGPKCDVAGSGVESCGDSFTTEARLVQGNSGVLDGSVRVSANDLSRCPGRSIHACLDQDLVNCHGADAKGATNLFAAGPSDIQFDRVITRRTVEFRGHVYNLSTPYGYFTTQGIITGNTIYRNATQRSYVAGRLQQLRDPEVVALRPYLKYIAITDGAECPGNICPSANGTILPADDPWWQRATPPRHHGCRCRVDSLRQETADAEGGPTENPPDPTSPEGWGMPPDEQSLEDFEDRILQRVHDTVDADLVKEFKRKQAKGK